MVTFNLLVVLLHACSATMKECLHAQLLKQILEHPVYSAFCSEEPGAHSQQPVWTFLHV
ncbi:uncharacterized protein DEA37_0004761 [Paragonimus westermani]|uniref:Uncharacterized protein n=1 Tax=Paragonimus westermani TaxID=34504 RepID=A0A5J4N434_9TREM|nr:uncharacterized protein DEA37_0004761 [Paragonimus westermani]